MNKYFIKMEEDCFYHIYNQGNNKEKIFSSVKDKETFKKHLYEYIQPFADIICFCLMDNHFHLLIHVKKWNEMKKHLDEFDGLPEFVAKIDSDDTSILAGAVVSEMFRRFFMRYALKYNFAVDRTGSLFRKRFRRKKITSLKYLRNLILYIHQNPSNHGVVKDFRKYPWSSYAKMYEADVVSDLRNRRVFDIFDIFGDKENYEKIHLLDRRSSDPHQIE